MPDGFPYILASEAAVAAGAWATDLGGGRQPVPEFLPAWDLSSTLDLERSIDIDLPRLRADTGVSSAAKLALTVAFSTERLDGCLTRLDLPNASEDTVPVLVDVSLPGRLMSGRVEVVTSVILAETLPRGTAPVAWRKGSVLWRDAKKVRLHGDATQFPLEVVDFEAHGINASSPWFVQLSPDLSLPVMGSVQLLVNARFAVVVDALQQASMADPVHEVILSSLNADVGRTLVEHLLVFDDDHADWSDESLGDVLRKLASSQLGRDVRALRGRRDSDASGWSSDTAAAFGLMGGLRK